jgi:transposase
MAGMSPELWNRIPPEAQVIFLEMAETIKRLEQRVEELERRLGMTPKNSSLPPSSQHPHAKPAPPKSKSKRKPGGQPGHEKFERALVPPERVHETITLKPETCRRCGRRLKGSDEEPLRHQVWELPEIKPIITEYQRHRLMCNCCGVTTCAELPCGVPEGQTGPQLAAFIALLMAYFRQSKRRVGRFCETVLNTPCSPGLAVKLQDQTTAALAPCYNELAQALPKASAANLDETGSKQGCDRSWIWVAVTSTFTLFAVRLARSAEVVRELLGETFGGTITTDRFGAYNSYPRRQACWAHLLRDFQALIDAGGSGKRIGLRLMEVARKLFHHWHRYRDGTVTRETMRRHVRQLKYPLWEILEDGQRSRHAPTAALCRDLFDRFDQLWMFLDDANVEPTNNAAERALRHAVIWRKLSFGTKSAAGSRFVETMLTVIETCRQQERDVFEFVTKALDRHFAHRRAPSLLAGV